MTATALLLAGLGFALAYVNGANDVSKGIATLVGSGVANYRRAIGWGALWTAGGALLGAVMGKAMLTAFGTGMLSAGTTPTLAAAGATLFGAAAWVLLATRTGLPVSTTHAIVGSLTGVAAVAYGVEGVQWGALGGKVVLPLLLTPVVSLVLVTLLLWSTQRRSPASPPTDCLCAQLEPVPIAAASGGAAVAVRSAGQLRIVTGSSAACAVEQPQALRLTLDHLHWLSSGATSLARGMNDAPKIAALVLAATALGTATQLSTPALFFLITAGMVLGSAVAGLKVTRLLAEKVTPMDHREGLASNLVTAALVAGGAFLGLPMSTTHVSSGGIVGIGARRGSLNLKTVRELALAWVVTLPAAALLGMAGYALARAVG